MHAVIAVPPIRDFYFTPHRYANLGIGIVARILNGHGYTVRVFNFPLARKKNAHLALPAELEYLRPFILPNETGPLGFFRSYRRFGPDFTECARLIGDEKPDIIFISCFAFAYAAECLELAARVKTLLPQVPIVAGGAGVSAHPRFFLKHSTIDFCLSGEAEITLPRFLEDYAGGQPPRAFRDSPGLFSPVNGNIYTRAEDIDFSFNRSFETNDTTYYSVCLSRGCSKNCRFCSLHLGHGRGFRTVPYEKAISVIKALAPEINKTTKQIRINFEDDNLLLVPEYFINILTAIRAHIPGVTFYAENGLDYTLLTPDLITTLICLGFRQFNLSLGSAHPGIARREHRIVKPKHYQELVHIIHRHALPCVTYFICGLKGDTVASIAQTLAFLAHLPTRSGISFFYAVPGLPDFRDYSVFNGVSPTLCKGSAAYPWNNSLTTQTMITAFRLSRLINLLKAPRRVSGIQATAEKSLLQLILKEKKLYTLLKTKDGPRPSPVSMVDCELVSEFFKRF